MKNLGLFIIGKLISVFGSAIYTFAIGLYVLKQTGSGFSFALTLFVGLIPTIIFSPVAGYMSDRFDKKKIVVSMDFANGMMFLILFLLTLKFELNQPMIYISTFMTTVFTTFFGIAFEAAKPNLVADEKLMSINSLSKVIDSTALILAPVLGGLIFAFTDIKTFILINAVCFIFSAGIETMIDFNYNIKSTAEINDDGGFVEDIKDGLTYIRKSSEIVKMINVLVILNFFISFSVTVPLPYIINNLLNLSSNQYGIIQGAFPVGMILGAVVVGKIIEKIDYMKLLIFSSITLSVAIALLGLPVVLADASSLAYMIYYISIMVIFGIAISFIDVPILWLMQKSIPDNLRGKVLSISMSIVKLIAPLGLVISGMIINSVPVYIMTFAGGGILMLSNLMILNQKNKPA
ncbi:Tetracycline resistance determinant tetV [Acetoanaerobium sticklandii]|uniref:Tetracycline resistance determinant tetV n=1 Tax=Acetoanaerobium sticklandii (strain ATCC 12662 / DSM 519 / JCM 1433 / CCUG 9281 / NCIMB 10654 / HF) TaxID=499177 RepID=E3PVU6_ACESD|nr:MFS transporter [Acetoanaerobium sticklandii]CBH22649.1 Tetracycline resistance determinant tetV [Acetoanaerobium sticklandii]